MARHQPTPFEFKNGFLVDAVGEQVRFRNKHNLKIIAEYMNPGTNPNIGELEERIDEILSHIDIETVHFLEKLGLTGD